MREQANIISSDRALTTSSRNDGKIAETVVPEFLIERFLGKASLLMSFQLLVPTTGIFMPQEKQQ